MCESSTSKYLPWCEKRSSASASNSRSTASSYRGARVLVERHARLRRQPAVAAADAELVAAVREDVRDGDRRRPAPEGCGTAARAASCGSGCCSRALRGGREQCRRVGGDRELREEEVLDHGVDVVAEPIGVDHLLEHLGVQLLRRLPGWSWISEYRLNLTGLTLLRCDMSPGEASIPPGDMSRQWRISANAELRSGRSNGLLRGSGA